MSGREKMAAFVNRSILKWLSFMTGHILVANINGRSYF